MGIGKEYPRSTPKDQIITLFEKTGFERFSRIEPVGTTWGRVAIGIFPYTSLTWNGNFFTMYGALQANNHDLTVARLFTNHDGKPLREGEEHPVALASARPLTDGNSYNLIAIDGNQIMLQEGLARLAESGSFYDPTKSMGARDHLLKIFANGIDLGHPAIQEAAKGIIRLQS